MDDGSGDPLPMIVNSVDGSPMMDDDSVDGLCHRSGVTGFWRRCRRHPHHSRSMVRPRRRGNRLLHLPGLGVNPYLPRTRACGYSGSNPASAPRSSRSFSPPSSSAPSTSFIYLLRVSHCITRRSSICFLLLSLSCLSCVSFIYLFPMCVILLRVPFYLLLRSHCLARRSSICLLCSSSC
jgi:hypothetical protein